MKNIRVSQISLINLIFLPATDPNDLTYGTVPKSLSVNCDVCIHQVYFPKLAWYNKKIREQAIGQIKNINVPRKVLVGFSKSGLGAWNIALSIPDEIIGTIIFDAPVARETLPPWGTKDFYSNDEEWKADLPIRHVMEFKSALPEKHRLILVSGANFQDEMSRLSRALLDANVHHTFRYRPEMKHHWQSGWIEEALNLLTWTE